MTSPAYEIEPLQQQHFPGFVALFEAAGSPCFCRFWHFSGTNNEWLDRCANAPGDSSAEMEQAVINGSADGLGLIARERATGLVTGWMKVATAASLKKVYDRRLYRGLPCFEGDRTGVFTIACFLVHPDHRKRALSVALVRAAVEIAPSWGARALEAFPRRPKEPVRDDELWTGPMGAFEQNGFVEVSAFEPYPVLRRELWR